MNFDETLQRLLDKLTEWGQSLVLLAPNLVVALIVLGLTSLVARGLSKLVNTLTERTTHHRSLAELLERLTRATIWVAGLVIALRVLQLDEAAAAALAGAGILGLALGFAFQDLTANFIAGVALAVRRPMSIGDIVETNGYRGIVDMIDLRTTVLRTFQGQSVRIPNRKIFEEVLVNYTTLRKRRVDLDVGVSYGDDLEKVKSVVVDTVSELPRDTSHDVELVYTGFGDSSINFTVRFWIPYSREIEFLQARSSAIIAIKKAFDNNDITIPFPIRTLDFGIKGGQTLSEMVVSTVQRGTNETPRS